MKKLAIEIPGPDSPTNLELLAEDLNLLGLMSKGEFNTPPWDNCNRNEARHVLQSMIDTIKYIARDNNITLRNLG
jgi:hypothetical protein